MEHLVLVGLADSGHARLFAALTGLDASASAERVLGVVHLPDDRLDRLAEMSESKKVVPATFEIAFLPGLSTEPGKGLGSRLLGSLRDCDAVLFVLRAMAGNDPEADLATLEYELVLADLASVEQRLDEQRRLAKGDKTLGPEIAALERAAAALGDGAPIYRSELSDDERALLAPVFLLTNKPVLSVLNIDDDRLDEAEVLAKQLGDDALAVCLELEGDPDVVAAEGP